MEHNLYHRIVEIIAHSDDLFLIVHTVSSAFLEARGNKYMELVRKLSMTNKIYTFNISTQKFVYVQWKGSLKQNSIIN